MSCPVLCKLPPPPVFPSFHCCPPLLSQAVGAAPGYCMQCKIEKATRVCDQCTFGGRKKPAWGGGKYHLCFACFAVRKITSLMRLRLLEPVLWVLPCLFSVLVHLPMYALQLLSCRFLSFSPILLVVVILRTVAVCQRSTSKTTKTTKGTIRAEGSLSILYIGPTIVSWDSTIVFHVHSPPSIKVLCKPKSFHHLRRNSCLLNGYSFVFLLHVHLPGACPSLGIYTMYLQERHADTPELTSHTFTPIQTPGSGELTCSLCDRPATRRFVGVSDAADAQRYCCCVKTQFARSIYPTDGGVALEYVIFPPSLLENKASCPCTLCISSFDPVFYRFINDEGATCGTSGSHLLLFH